MGRSQTEKFSIFKALHAGPTFVIPNPGDAGTALIPESLGFAALATTSPGYTFSAGKRDCAAVLSRGGILDNSRAIFEATDLPVSSDLEGGFGDAWRACAAPDPEAPPS